MSNHKPKKPAIEESRHLKPETPAPQSLQVPIKETQQEVATQVSDFLDEEARAYEKQIQDELAQIDREYSQLIGRFNPQTGEWEGVEDSDYWKIIKEVCPQADLGEVLSEVGK